MSTVKVIKVCSDQIEFDNGVILSSDHRQDCCESHYLHFADLTIEDFEGLEFDLTDENFFKRIVDYGIELIPIKGHSVKVPGYGYNNGYYSDQLELTLTGNGINKTFDISECQEVKG